MQFERIESVMDLLIMECDGVMRLPRGVREAAHLQEGTVLEVTITDDGILLRTRRPTDNEETWPAARDRLMNLHADAEETQVAQSYRVSHSLEELFRSLEPAAGEHADV